MTLMCVTGVDVQTVVERGCDIDQFGEGLTRTTGSGDVYRWFDDQGYMEQAVLQRAVCLLRQAIVAGEVSVVREEEDPRVVIQTTILQCLNDATKESVDGRAHPVVDAFDLPPCLFGDRLATIRLTERFQDLRVSRPVLADAWGQQFRIDRVVCIGVDFVSRVGASQRDVAAERIISCMPVDPVDRAAYPGRVTIPTRFLTGCASRSNALVVDTVTRIVFFQCRWTSKVHFLQMLTGRIDLLLTVARVVVLRPHPHEVVLTAPQDAVSLPLQNGQQVGFLLLEHVPHGAVPVNVRIEPGHERASAGCADRVLRKGIAVGYGALLDESVEVRGDGTRVFLMPQYIAPVGVGNEQDNVGFPGHTWSRGIT